MGHTGTGPHNSSNDGMPQIISHRVLEDVIRVLHRNCDPADMTFEDHLVWEEWNKKFHPEHYAEVNESEGDGTL